MCSRSLRDHLVQDRALIMLPNAQKYNRPIQNDSLFAKSKFNRPTKKNKIIALFRVLCYFICVACFSSYIIKLDKDRFTLTPLTIYYTST